LTDPASL
jgi:large subunit ribosomal protein LP0